MTSEHYHKCRSCKFCVHEGESWKCRVSGEETGNDGSCDMYRPGSCEFCHSFDSGVCSRTGQEVFEFEVCTDFDPRGSV